MGENIVYATDDKVIRNVLRKLHHLNPASNPSPRMIETAATDVDAHSIIVGYDDQMALYWFTYFTTVGDSGYHLYRITDFTGLSVNLLEYGYLFDLPESSMTAFYMDVYSRLNEWVKLLELPYRYEVELRDEYMGFERINKPDRALTSRLYQLPVVVHSGVGGGIVCFLSNRGYLDTEQRQTFHQTVGGPAANAGSDR